MDEEGYLIQDTYPEQLRWASTLPPRLADIARYESAPFQVIASSLSTWDTISAESWPRVPGNVVVCRDLANDLVYFCGGYLPCGNCPSCNIGLQLSCIRPIRPGHNHLGGLGTIFHLPATYRTQLSPLLPGFSSYLEAVVLLAAAGTTYQAQVSAGMCPGDTVIVNGEVGPGALPLAVLAASGLRVLWLRSSSPAFLPQGVHWIAETPPPTSLPSPVCHLLDFAPDAAAITTCASIFPVCLSYTRVGPSGPSIQLPVQELLRRQIALRGVRDLHPQLVLDLLRLLLEAKLEIKPWLQVLSAQSFPAAFHASCRGDLAFWPVFAPAAM